MKNKYNKIISIVLMLTMIIGYLPNYSISFAETLDESSLEIEMEDGVISYKTWEAKAIAEEGIRYSIEGLSIHTKLSPSGSPNVEGKVGLSKVGDDRDLENGFLELSWEVSETELRQALTDNGIDIIEKGTKVYVSGIYQTHYRYLDGSMTIRKENLDSFNEIANAEAWSNSTDVFKQWFNIPFTFDPLPMPITVNAIDSSSGNVFSSYELDDYMPENNRNVPVNISDLSSSALPKTFESAKYYTASVDDSSKAEDLKESFSTENIILEDTYINGGVLEVYYKAPEGGSGLDIGVYGTASPRSVQANGSDEVSVTVNVESEIFDIGSLNVESYKLEVEDEEFTFTNGDSNVEHDFKMKIDTSKYQEDDEFTDSISKTWNIKATANLSDGSILSKTTTDKTTVVKGFDPPIVDLYLPSSVKLGDSVDMRASASSPQGSDIDEYYWNFDNVDQPYDGKPSVNDYFFEEEGEHNVEVIAVDSNGMGGSDEGTIEVLPPTVDASITTTGHLKEYRKISVSSLGSDSPEKYPIVDSETLWTKSPSASIIVDSLLDRSREFSMIVNDDIEVELTLYLENTLGKSDWETKTLDIIADAPPNADFTMLNTVYRNPLDSNNAVVNIHNISSSPDGDAIANLKGYYTYDSNNDGIFSEEKVKFYDGVNIDNLSFTSDKVGKYKVELEVRETYETLEGYEKQVPYLSDTTADKDLAECIIEIDNQAPTMDLTVINRIPVSIDFQLGNFDIDAEMLEDYISNNLVPTLESNGYELESYNIYEGKNAEAIESTADFSSIMDEQIDEDDQLHTVNIYNYKYFNEDYVLIDGYYTVDLYKIEGGELINITSLDGNYRAYSDGLIRESDKKGDTIGYYNIFGEEIEGSDELEGLEPQEKISDNISYDSIFVKSHKNEYDDRDVTKTYNEINRINIDSGSSINIRPYYLYRENVHWDSGSGTATTTDKTASVYKISENTELVFIKNTIDNAGHSTDRTFDSFKLFTFKNQIEENMKADRDYYVYLNNDENDILKIDEYRNKLVEVLMSNGLKFSTISQDADEIKEIAETTSGFNALTLDDFKRQLIENLDAEYKSDSSNEFKFLLDSAIVFDEMYLDYENDPRFQGRFKIDHVDPDYYENGLGVIESDGVYKILDDDSELKLDKTGKFILEPQVQDKPIDDVNFIDYYKWSEELVQNTIYVHRKPIADFEIEFYKDLLVTENNSYDIDHQSEFGKGIALSEWKHQKEDDYWIDGLPLDTEIEDMTDYTIALRVKDLEGAWSDWTVKEVNSGILEEKPIMLEGKLKTEESKFSVRSVPASEYLSIYNIKTEYKNDVSLEVYLENLYGEKIVNIKNLNFAEGVSGSQNIVDEMKVIDWNDIRYQIPPNLPDGNYNINIIAVNSLDTTKTTSLLLPFIVETPINLKSDLRQVKASEEKVITASSSLYTDSLELELFEGTDKSITLDMHEIASDESRKTWQVIYELGDFIDSGLYKGKFTGRTLNGNSESLVKDFELKSLEISEVEISGGWNHWRGQIDMFGAQLEENPLRFLSYEMMTIEVSIEGQVEEVTIRMSDELESMNYVDIYGNVINYRDELDYEVDFPVKMKEDKGKWTYKYVLPVAPSTLDWDDRRVENPYFVEIRAKSPEDENGESITLVKRIENIELTGNIYELIFLQPQ